MTYRAVFDPPARPLGAGPGALSAGPGPALRRPAGTGRRPVTAGLLSGAAGRVPAFLRVPTAAGAADPGARLDPEAPIEIVDFDPQEDILSLVFDPDSPLPDLSIAWDEGRAVTALLADGKPIVLLHRPGPGFSLRNVAVTCYAA